MIPVLTESRSLVMRINIPLPDMVGCALLHPPCQKHMIELLAAWGATEFIFKPVLESLAQEAAKDWAKDIFKNSLSNVLHLPSKESKKIGGKAIREFLSLMYYEFEGAGLSGKG